MLKQTAFAMLLAMLLPTGLPLAAQARPVLHPTRDVAVQYRVTGGHGRHDAAEVTIHYAAHGQHMRIEPAGRPSYLIVDRVADRMDMVMPAQHMYVDMPYDPQKMLSFEDKNATFAPHGSDTVAGLPCTVYDVHSRGHSGQICLTDDGVMLRAHGQHPGQGGSLEAVKVTYATQPRLAVRPAVGLPQARRGTPATGRRRSAAALNRGIAHQCITERRGGMARHHVVASAEEAVAEPVAVAGNPADRRVGEMHRQDQRRGVRHLAEEFPP